jgi:hypothetical protein
VSSSLTTSKVSSLDLTKFLTAITAEVTLVL